MNKQDLCDLRRKGAERFENVSGLRLFLDDFLGKDFVFPAVVGYEGGSDKDLKVRNLSSVSEDTSATVRCYLACLNEIILGEKSEAKRGSTLVEKPETFRGSVFYRGLESFHSSNLDSYLLGVSIRLDDGVKHPQTFGLNFYFSQGRDIGVEEAGVGYRVESVLPETALEKACRRFVGPNYNPQE